MQDAPSTALELRVPCELCEGAAPPDCGGCLGAGRRPIPVIGEGCFRHGIFPSEPTASIFGIPCPECWFDALPDTPRGTYIRQRVRIQSENDGPPLLRGEDESGPDVFFDVGFADGFPSVVREITPASATFVRGEAVAFDEGSPEVYPPSPGIRRVGLTLRPIPWADAIGGIVQAPSGRRSWRCWGVMLAWLELSR